MQGGEPQISYVPFDNLVDATPVTHSGNGVVYGHINALGFSPSGDLFAAASYVTVDTDTSNQYYYNYRYGLVRNNELRF